MVQQALYKYLMALVLFGTNGVVASFVPLPSYQIVLLRTFLGSLFLLAIFIVLHGRFTFYRHRRGLFFIALSGVAMGASWLFQYEAYRLIGVSLTSLAYYTGPVIIMGLSPLLFCEIITRGKLLGFAIVLTGVLLITGTAVQLEGCGEGLVYGLLSAVMYAAMIIFNKKSAGITGLENALLQLCAAFITVAAYNLLHGGFAPASALTLPAMLMLGLVNTGMGCYLYFSSIGYLPVQTVAVCDYLEPLAAVIFAALLLGEAIYPVQLIGVACIMAGVLYSQRR